MGGLFAEYETPEPVLPPLKGPPPKPVAVPPKRLSPWTLMELDAAIDHLRRDRDEQWDCLIPEAVLNAARLLPPAELIDLADHLLARLTNLRTRIVEASRADV